MRYVLDGVLEEAHKKGVNIDQVIFKVIVFKNVSFYFFTNRLTDHPASSGIQGWFWVRNSFLKSMAL